MSKNVFGGGNKNSLYTPMSEYEQEVLSRLVEARDLDVTIVGWGYIKGVKANHGDLRLNIPLEITFSAPETPILVDHFDLELRTGSGLLLFKERQSAKYNGQPLPVGAGTSLSMVWSIAIKAMAPDLVKMYKPGAVGLTSRWVDRDTGAFSFLGNTKLPESSRALLRKLRRGEAKVRAMNRKDAGKK